MIIHHWTGKKELLTKLIKAVRTKKLSLLLCYKDPQSGARGIVEFERTEVAEILGALQSENAVDDVELFKRFAGRK